jgi:cobalt-zinc-cadmium efflux system protein
VAILVGVGAVMWEAVGRVASPPDVPGLPVLLVATVGIGVNIGTALLFRGHGAHDLNALHAAPICTWRRMRPSRLAWSARRR